MSHYPKFEIPNSWEWVRLDEIYNFIDYRGATPTKISRGVPLITAKNVKEGYIDYTISEYISIDEYNNRQGRGIPQFGDILFTTEAPLGNVALADKIIYSPGQRIITFKEFCTQTVYNHFYLFFFLSDFFKQLLIENKTGSGVEGIQAARLKGIHIPLPPYNDQKRIYDAIIKWTHQHEFIFKEKIELARLIITTKSKILELAMQGKLVPQDPADEPAADMLRRINPKARIITDNPHSRNIPRGWCDTTVSELCVFLSRGKSPKYSDSPNQYPVFAQKCNLKDGGISLNQARFLDEGTLNKWPAKYRLKTGDVLINSTGTGTVGRTRYFDECCLGSYPFTVPDSHVSVVRSFDEINSKFLFYYLYSPNIQQYFEDNLAGSTNQKELYIDIIGSTPLILPPVSEQKRIVLKIEELYSVLDEIEASLQS